MQQHPDSEGEGAIAPSRPSRFFRHSSLIMTPSSADPPDFDQALHEVDLSLQSLKDLHALLSRDPQGLRSQGNGRRTPLEALQAELRRVYENLNQLDVVLQMEALEAGSETAQPLVKTIRSYAALLWRIFRDDFWQAVRFGGLGLLLGWALRSCAG